MGDTLADLVDRWRSSTPDDFPGDDVSIVPLLHALADYAEDVGPETAIGTLSAALDLVAESQGLGPQSRLGLNEHLSRLADSFDLLDSEE
jgi:hypothetical protein